MLIFMGNVILIRKTGSVRMFRRPIQHKTAGYRLRRCAERKLARAFSAAF
ncbi:hypothetical protein CLOSTASPAR_03151 [[Clostridium] asparagiforme DSM 15981]|uniref:Uncharacterized protein n=1 Tax=[Clostridium] asparagiforme DSM 15981 TaxID=518636 RepID=C0D1L3_9FIRM|nr:hypothetical protein CLOSTASPAR_03151 [[Clostridium] asparagiforme DSM 15981]